MYDLFIYLFWPNPGNTSYNNTSMMVLLAVSAAFIVASIGIRFWRRGQSNQMTKKLSRSWATAMMWFGITALVMVVSRGEGIQFMSMRVLWFVWAAFLALYLYFQVRQFRLRHYEILPSVRVVDPRAKYLPKKK